MPNVDRGRFEPIADAKEFGQPQVQILKSCVGCIYNNSMATIRLPWLPVDYCYGPRALRIADRLLAMAAPRHGIPLAGFIVTAPSRNMP